MKDSVSTARLKYNALSIAATARMAPIDAAILIYEIESQEDPA